MYDEAFAARTIASPDYARLARAETAFLIRAMALRKGESLLDAPCGTGRHALIFTARGIRVTGLDLNPVLLRLARRRDRKSKYVRADLLSLADSGSPHRERYDAVVNLFTSFGYFRSEEKNFRVLRGLVASLKPGGRLAMNLVDRDWLLRNFRATSHTVSEGVDVLELRVYDAPARAIESHTLSVDIKRGTTKSYFHRTRLYSKPEMVKLLKAAGLRRVVVYGDSDGSNYRKYETSHPTYIGYKD